MINGSAIVSNVNVLLSYPKYLVNWYVNRKISVRYKHC